MGTGSALKGSKFRLYSVTDFVDAIFVNLQSAGIIDFALTDSIVIIPNRPLCRHLHLSPDFLFFQ